MAFPVALALLFFVLHLPYLPKSLEDLDSINFALGVRRFDVAHHQPHPPGYPVYIALAKGIHALISHEARALGMLSVISGAIGVLAVATLFRRIDDAQSTPGWTVASTAVAMTSPLYYFTAVRPLSDATGLAAAIAIQSMTVGARSARALVSAAFCAGLATGIRSQVAWLTVPLIAWQLALHRRRALHHGGHGGQGGKNPESFPALASAQGTISRVSTVTGSEQRGGRTSSAIVITGRATHSAAR